jgi:hypothetical protein
MKRVQSVICIVLSVGTYFLPLRYHSGAHFRVEPFLGAVNHPVEFWFVNHLRAASESFVDFEAVGASETRVYLGTEVAEDVFKGREKTKGRNHANVIFLLGLPVVQVWFNICFKITRDILFAFTAQPLIYQSSIKIKMLVET